MIITVLLLILLVAILYTLYTCHCVTGRVSLVVLLLLESYQLKPIKSK